MATYRKQMTTQVVNPVQQQGPTLGQRLVESASGVESFVAGKEKARLRDEEKQRVELEKQVKRERDIYTKKLKIGVNSDINNLYQQFSNDPQAFMAESRNIADKAISGVDDELIKQDIALSYESQISEKAIKVRDNFNTTQANVQKNTFREGANTSLVSLQDNAAILLSKDPDNVSKQAYKKNLETLYKSKDNTDENGNYLLAKTQRDAISDFYDNSGYYSTLQWLTEYHNDDPATLVKMRDEARSDRASFAKKYNISENKMKDLIKGIDDVIADTKTPDQLMTEATVKSGLELKYKEFDVKKGRVGNFKLNNASALSDYRDTLQAEYAKGNLDFDFYNKKMGSVNSLINKAFNDGKISRDPVLNNAYEFTAKPKLDGLQSFMGLDDSNPTFQNFRSDYFNYYSESLSAELANKGLTSDDVSDLKPQEQQRIYRDAYRLTLQSYITDLGYSVEGATLADLEQTARNDVQTKVRRNVLNMIDASYNETTTELMTDAQGNKAWVKVYPDGKKEIIEELN